MRQPTFPLELLAEMTGPEPLESSPAHNDSSVEHRIVDGLLDMLLVADELLSCLQVEEANTFLWIEPHLHRVCTEIDAVLRRVAN